MNCLTFEQMELLARGAADPCTAAALRQHLEQCAACTFQFEEWLANEEVLHKLEGSRGSGAPGGGGDSPVIAETVRAPTIARHPAAKTQPDAPSSFPQRIGSYHLLRKIGEGGMGVVYEAEQDSPRRIVALKVIKPGATGTGALKRFEHEAEILGRLLHPGIAQIYEAGTADTGHGPQPFFAMEFVRGRTLTEHANEHHLGARPRLELFTRICDAVQHAHQKGVVHRDLKPANILVVDENGRGTDVARGARTSSAIATLGQPKILDFGVARATDSDLQTTTRQTDIGQLIGTVPYMSPEQVSGDPDQVDTRSDIYALGVVLYELLAGRLPYDLRSKMLHDAVRVIREEEPTRLSSIDRTLRGDLETIVGKALEKDKDRRYQSVSALAADIRHYLSDEPITARPPSATYQLRKFTKRNKALVGGVVSVFIVLIAGVVVSTALFLRAERARAAQIEQRKLAEANAAKARRRFDQVRKLTNTFMFDFHDQIANVPGATRAREFLVKTAVQYLDELAPEAADDASLQRDVAVAYLKLGDVQGNPNFAGHLGDADGALASYRNAQRILEALIARDSADPIAWRNLAVCVASIGDILAASGQAEAALANYRKALEIRERLASAEPENADSRASLAGSYSKIGSVLAELGQTEPALASYRKALEIRKALAAAEPAGTAARRRVAVSQSRIAELLMLNDDLDGALASFTEALEIFAPLASAEPENGVAQRDLAVCHDGLGNVLRMAGELEKARTHYQKSLAVSQALWGADPANAEAGRDVAASYCNLGQLGAAAGSDVDVPVAERVDAWRQARAWYLRAVEALTGMRARGILSAGDLSLFETLTQQISRCDRNLAELAAPDTANDPASQPAPVQK